MIHIILGTKAQLIKMAPIMIEFQNRNIEYNFIFTGQHKETIDKLKINFSLKDPDYILYEGSDITNILQALRWSLLILIKVVKNKNNIFKNDSHGVVLVHGDTFSTILGAIAGKFAKLKVAHIESGLRSHNIFHPFPEEITRLLVFHLSDYFFCPGEWAARNVEKYKGQKINTEANTLVDSLRLAIKNLNSQDSEKNEKYAICSIHRFENIFREKQLLKIISIIEEVSKKIKILFILHPSTNKRLKKYNLYNKLSNKNNIELRPRYDYFDFIKLLYHSQFIITDGGSNQEESYYLGKPCLLLRKKTERQEGLNQNVIISNFDRKIIRNFIERYCEHKVDVNPSKFRPSKIIINNLKEFINF